MHQSNKNSQLILPIITLWEHLRRQKLLASGVGGARLRGEGVGGGQSREEHDINTTEFSVWDKPDTRTPFQKGDEPVLSDLKKAGVYVYPVRPVNWKTPTDVETPPERIHVTYCDHIENTEETSESDEGREN